MLRRILALVLVLILAAPLALAWSISSKVVETPHYPGSDTASTPMSAAGLAFEEIAFRTGDGLTLHGWVVPAAGQARAAIVAAHGRGGSRRSFLESMSEWHAAGYCVLAYDTRGFGQSESAGPGDGFAGGWQDIVAAAHFARMRCGVRRVGVVGSSQGASNAIRAAARDPSIDAVVAQGAGTNLYALLRAQSTMKGLPDAMIGLISRLSLLRMHAPWSAVIDPRLGPGSVVQLIAPRALFLIHGSADETVPVAQARELYARAGQPKSLWVIEGGGHQGLRRLAADYNARVLAFLARYLLGA